MIIFGLGNPGIKYHGTRHNAGYLLVETIARLRRRRFRTRPGYQIARTTIDHEPIMLIKPLCWMNESGVIIYAILHDEDDKFIVVVDDINLPVGRMRIRKKGSDGGHRGLRSIIEELGTKNFPRLRIGIGQTDGDVAEYVLSSFRRKEKKLFKMVIEEAIEGIEILVKTDFATAQNYINSINIGDID